MQFGLVVDKEHNVLAADWDALHRREAHCNCSDVVAAKTHRADCQSRRTLPASLVCSLRTMGAGAAGDQRER
ncbi:MAG: hypothetical protein U0X20_31595 [Caldilineaceae bacterium]